MELAVEILFILAVLTAILLLTKKIICAIYERFHSILSPILYVFIIIGLIGFFSENTEILIILLICIGVKIVREIFFTISYKLDKIFGTKGYIPPPPSTSTESYENEGIFHMTKRLQHDIVLDDYGEEVYIDHITMSANDELGNKSLGIKKITDTYIIDSDNHIRMRNN